MKPTNEMIAKVCHQANKAWCESNGDNSQLDWEDAPKWQKDSAIDGVKFHKTNPDAKASHSHEQWMKFKEREGWTYGPTKDVEKKRTSLYGSVW